MQVDVFTLPDYRLSNRQKEWLWLFSLMVAGKSAEFATKKLNILLHGWSGTPFNAIDRMLYKGTLDENLRAAKTGQYRKLTRAYEYTVKELYPIWHQDVPALRRARAAARRRPGSST